MPGPQTEVSLTGKQVYSLGKSPSMCFLCEYGSTGFFVELSCLVLCAKGELMNAPDSWYVTVVMKGTRIKINLGP